MMNRKFSFAENAIEGILIPDFLTVGGRALFLTDAESVFRDQQRVEPYRMERFKANNNFLLTK